MVYSWKKKLFNNRYLRSMGAILEKKILAMTRNIVRHLHSSFSVELDNFNLKNLATFMVLGQSDLFLFFTPATDFCMGLASQAIMLRKSTKNLFNNLLLRSLGAILC